MNPVLVGFCVKLVVVALALAAMLFYHKLAK